MDDLGFVRRIRTLAVVAMFSDEVLRSRLVLKGGNLMDLVFDTVRATVKPEFPLREYDFYFDYVLTQCRDLESLWHE